MKFGTHPPIIYHAWSVEATCLSTAPPNRVKFIVTGQWPETSLGNISLHNVRKSRIPFSTGQKSIQSFANQNLLHVEPCERYIPQRTKLPKLPKK